MTDEEIIKLAYERDMKHVKSEYSKEQLELWYCDKELVNDRVERVKYFMSEKGMTIDEALDYFESLCEYTIRKQGKEYVYSHLCVNCERRLTGCNLL